MTRLLVCPDDREINVTTLAAVVAFQERFEVSDQPVARLATPLDDNQDHAVAGCAVWHFAEAFDTHAIGDRQVLDASFEKCLHIRT